jgi:PTS system nitrogen regulatory IIA component
MRLFARSAPPRVPSMPIAQAIRPAGADPVWRWVCPRHIALDVDVRGRRDALSAIASLCAEAHDLPPAPLLRALWRREQAGSTALGHGVAIPHARIDHIEQPLTLFVRTRVPVAFGAPDGQAVSDLYAILVPMVSDHDAHLTLLARIAEMFSDPELRVRVTTASTPAVAHSIFADWVVRRMQDPLTPKTARR